MPERRPRAVPEGVIQRSERSVRWSVRWFAPCWRRHRWRDSPGRRTCLRCGRGQRYDEMFGEWMTLPGG